MNLSKLLIIHAIITFAAGIVLIVAPNLIPSAVDIYIDSRANLVCYLLGTSELALAFLSFSSRNLKDVKALRLISLTFIVLHFSTAIVEIFALTQGLSSAIWSNIALRIVVSVLFWYYGIYKNSSENRAS